MHHPGVARLRRHARRVGTAVARHRRADHGRARRRRAGRVPHPRSIAEPRLRDFRAVLARVRLEGGQLALDEGADVDDGRDLLVGDAHVGREGRRLWSCRPDPPTARPRSRRTPVYRPGRETPAGRDSRTPGSRRLNCSRSRSFRGGAYSGSREVSAARRSR